MSFLRLAALAFLLCLAPTVPAGAEVTLDAVRRQHLAELLVLRNPLAGPQALAGRVVVVNFFASWCPPCHPEFRALVQLERRYRAQGLAVVSVNVFEEWDGAAKDDRRLKGFLDRYRPEFAVVRGDARTKALFGDVARIPSVFVFARDGGTFHRFIHLENAEKTHLTADELDALVRAALGRSS